jgi:hypothetical protein
LTPQQFSIIGSAIFIGAFVLGLRASIRLTLRYRGARMHIDERNRPVLLAIVLAAWIITVAAAWIGLLSVLRLLLETTFPWTPPVTLAIAAVVTLIPVAFDLAISRVSRL